MFPFNHLDFFHVVSMVFAKDEIFPSKSPSQTGPVWESSETEMCCFLRSTQDIWMWNNVDIPLKIVVFPWKTVVFPWKMVVSPWKMMIFHSYVDGNDIYIYIHISGWWLTYPSEKWCSSLVGNIHTLRQTQCHKPSICGWIYSIAIENGPNRNGWFTELKDGWIF